MTDIARDRLHDVRDRGAIALQRLHEPDAVVQEQTGDAERRITRSHLDAEMFECLLRQGSRRATHVGDQVEARHDISPTSKKRIGIANAERGRRARQSRAGSAAPSDRRVARFRSSRCGFSLLQHQQVDGQLKMARRFAGAPRSNEARASNMSGSAS